MNKILEKHKWVNLVFAVILIAIGTVCIIVACVDKKSFQLTLSVIIAIGLFIFALISLLSSLIGDNKSFFSTPLIYASISIALGIILCSDTNAFGTFITKFISTLLITFGGVEAAKGLFLLLFKAKLPLIIIALVIGTLGIAFGIISFCKPNETETVAYVVAGALIALTGLVNLINQIIDMIVDKKNDKVVATQDIKENIEIENIE